MGLKLVRIKKYEGYKPVMMATELYEKVKELSEITNLPITYIVNRCIDYAIENVEVEKW